MIVPGVTMKPLGGDVSARGAGGVMSTLNRPVAALTVFPLVSVTWGATEMMNVPLFAAVKTPPGGVKKYVATIVCASPVGLRLTLVTVAAPPGPLIVTFPGTMADALMATLSV